MEPNPLLRQLPQIDALLRRPELAGLSPAAAAPLARKTVEEARQRILSGEVKDAPSAEDLCAAILQKARGTRLREVLNGTGVVLHTNLGRACLSEAAARAVVTAARRYSDLEYDLASGARGARDCRAEALLRTLTGAERALVVNNNAAAVLLALTAVAGGGEAVISRGELVEIGGSFRIPELAEQCGCKLREVGTTNKTRLRDYRKALGPETRAVLKVHTSNYRVVGFTESVSLPQLAELAHSRRLPVIQDLGSGCLTDLWGEPTVQACLRSGADIVTFSGDKLLGGPQAGLLAGSARWIEPLRRHPLARALRVDKLTLAALEATLETYLDPRRAQAELPVPRMLSETPETLRRRGEALLSLLGEDFPAALVETEEPAGGGSLPERRFAGLALAVTPAEITPEELARRLRTGERPVLGRVRGERYLLHLRTLWDEDLPCLASALREALP